MATTAQQPAHDSLPAILQEKVNKLVKQLARGPGSTIVASMEAEVSTAIECIARTSVPEKHRHDLVLRLVDVHRQLSQAKQHKLADELVAIINHLADAQVRVPAVA